MDIAALSMAMSQSRVQESASIALKMAMDTGKETATQMTDMMKIVVVNPNLGQNLDVSA
jgi:hypothetical protein